MRKKYTKLVLISIVKRYVFPLRKKKEGENITYKNKVRMKVFKIHDKTKSTFINSCLGVDFVPKMSGKINK
jgi:hypothetical protein